MILLIAGGLILSAAAGLFLLPRVAAHKIDRSIAVLPFQNLSDEKENAYFADGVQDDLLTNLSKIGDLKVISRTSVMPYRATQSNAREIGKALGVGTILEGSVRRVGNRVRVNVQLINAENDQHIWAEDYDRELTDVFAIQSDLAQKIASELRAKLSPIEKAQIERKPTENSEAYLAFVEGHDLLTRPDRLRADTEKAEQLFERATRLDPNFARAFAALAWVEDWMYHSFDPTPARKAKAQAAAEEALRLAAGPAGGTPGAGLLPLLLRAQLPERFGRIRHRQEKFAELCRRLSGDWSDSASPGQMGGIHREYGESRFPESKGCISSHESR